MYVETDFLLALVKTDDWLREAAERSLEHHQIHTSLLAYAELLTYAYEPDEGIAFDVPRVVANLLERVPIRPESHEDVALGAATFLDENDMTPFDAFHAGIAATSGDRIHASDRAYEHLDVEWVPLTDRGAE